MLLQHDNTRPHTNTATSVVKEYTRFEVLPHPLYSMDLASSDLWLFASLKEYLQEIYFTCDDEVQAATRIWFQGEPE